jgi:hypothetical protein
MKIIKKIAFLSLCAWVSSVFAAVPLTQGMQFQVIGIIQHFELDPVTTTPGKTPVCTGVNPALRGAKMTVNGINIIIPCNTIITMPGSYLTPEDIFRGPSLNPGLNAVLPQSGLALDDTPPPVGTYEATIEGNIVGGRHIAGLVNISQQALNNGSGYITEINYSTGMMRVGSSLTLDPVNDARVRLNDPEGRYGLQTLATDTQFPTDQRFTSDDGNPTVHAETGFPMCVPRTAPPTNDTKCPTANRPSNPRLTTFVMGAALPNFPAAVPCAVCDPNMAAPLVVGDFINYSGTLAKDSTGTLYISAHTLAAAVGIYTQPGQKPVYVNQEVSLIGTGGAPINDPRVVPQTNPPTTITQEVSSRDIKVEGFATDPSQLIDIFAVKVNPCTGEEPNPVLMGTATPEDIPFGRFRFDVRRATSPVPIPLVREFRVKARQGTMTTANDLLAGQYTAPVSEYIFPENHVMGDPIIPFNFQDMPFLTQGSGPLCTLDRQDLTTGKCTGPIVRQLNPWPGSPVPASTTCGP